MTIEKPSKTESKKGLTRTVGVIVIKGQEVLLVRHTEKARQPTGMYGFPAGRVEGSETDRQTGVRELEEETGLTVLGEDLLEVPGNYFKGPLPLKDRTEDFSFTALLCMKFEGELRPSLDGKTVPEWVRIDNLPTQILPDVNRSISNALEFLELEK